jgi:lysophospholipase L1-like esterase
MKLNALVCLSGLAVIAVAASAPEKFALKDGDRVVFYGDSITDQRLYTTFIETYVVTRFPKLNVSFVHSGWGGDRVTGGGGGPIDVRLNRDVFAYKPTVMTIMLGMNDGSYRALDEGIFDTYKKGYQHIIDEVKNAAPDIRLTLIEPSPFDDVTQPPKFEGGYNGVLIHYAQFVKELAEQKHAGLADLNTPVVAALEKAKATNAELAKKIIPDRVHPGPSGHLLMAAELLKSWNAPATVTVVELDAADRKSVAAQATKVTDFKADSGLTWTQQDQALPMPVDLNDSVMALAVGSSDFMESLDQQTLKVNGLKESNYALKIDGSEMGTFTKDQLAEGINLASLATPMSRQALDVHKLTLQHNDVHFTRWRQVQLKATNATPASLQRALEALDALEGDLVKQQRAAAQPVPHRYELAPK